jgi:hypothetical protein
MIILNNKPWLRYKFNDDGSAIIKKCCITKKYSIHTMEKIWNEWYIKIINPNKLSKLLKISIFDAQIQNLCGIKIEYDITTKLYGINNFNNITVIQIIGLFFLNIDIDLMLHKFKFIEALQIKCNLSNSYGLEELFNGLHKWTTHKFLLYSDKKKWKKYDINIFYINNKTPYMCILEENDLIKIKLFGSVLYDKLISHQTYLYLIMNKDYFTIDSLINKYYYWMRTRKYNLI